MPQHLRYALVFVAAGMAACATEPATAVRRSAARGAAMGYIPYHLFPELPTSAAPNPWFGASIPVSPTAAPCVPVALPETTWLALRAPTRSRSLGALTLRLPPTYTVRPNAGEVPPGAEGGVLIGSWSDTTGGPRSGAREPANVAAWEGPESGYPTVGADTAARQVAAAECVSAAPVAGTHIVTFSLVSPRGRQEFLAAVWPFAPGRYVRVQAWAARAADLDAVRRSLAAAVVEPPAPR